MVAVGDDERAVAVTPDQQDRGHGRAGRDLGQVIGDVLVVLVEQGQLAGPEDVLGLAGGHAGRGGQLVPVGRGVLDRHEEGQVVLGSLEVVLLRLRQPLRLGHRASASCTCLAMSSSGIATVVPVARSVSSAVPPASPRLPMVIRNGMPTSSASLNLTPARTARSSRMTSTPVSSSAW